MSRPYATIWPSSKSLLEMARAELEERDRVVVVEDNQPLGRQRYYTRACFKVNDKVGDRCFEVADGGFTDWTERLLDDRRERLLISAAGLDQLVRP